MDPQRVMLLAEIPFETGLTGVVHTDSGCNDYIVIMSVCHRQECSKSILIAAFLSRFLLGV